MKPVSVSVLSDAIRNTLNGQFSGVLVQGELSGISRPRSGHVYLTLKDEYAQISAVLWRTTAEQLKFKLEDGQKVVCGGYVDIYPQRGTYQLIIQKLRPVGIGELELAYRQLYAKLESAGLFDPAIKKPLPKYPKKVALITSPSGAAIRDFLQVLARRWRNTEVVVIPVKVQGPGSAEEIATAIHSVSKFANPPDAVVVTRGGGSKEDLWSFNEEIVCRAIHACAVPVISAVGHEIDVSLSDKVADVRALTPSEAAELLVPERSTLVRQLGNVKQRMQRSLLTRLAAAETDLQQIRNRPVFARPMMLVERRAEQVAELERRLSNAIERKHERLGSELGALAGRLETINPLAVLARGYSLTSKTVDNAKELLTDANQLDPGDEIESRLLRGTVISKVLRVESDENA